MLCNSSISELGQNVSAIPDGTVSLIFIF